MDIYSILCSTKRLFFYRPLYRQILQIFRKCHGYICVIDDKFEIDITQFLCAYEVKYLKLDIKYQ